MRILCTITDELVAQLETLTFGPPVTHVYNPLVYARKSYDVYLNRYALRPKEIVLVGMNPGPWGMTQTGVPFGEVRAVKNWLGIQTEVGVPQNVHPKRPVTGFSCEKSEVSG
ncbi:MAG: single-stranded DNA-binding protein, partial [Desulfobacterales bacterium]